MIPLCSPEQARRPTALALGSFDGLHAGHRTVIRHAVKADVGVPTVVSFWPHPREVLYGDARLRLDLPEEKLTLLGPLGVEQLVLVPFTRELAGLSGEDFVRTILLETLQARHIAVGANFRFGRGRTGDTALLQRIAAAAGVGVDVVGIVEDQQGRMSSSRIRAALPGRCPTSSCTQKIASVLTPLRTHSGIKTNSSYHHQLTPAINTSIAPA